MAGGRPKAFPDVVGDLNDPESFASHLRRFYASSRAKGYTEWTLRNWTASLRLFTQWCLDRSLTQPKQITYPILSRYQRYLVYYRQSTGEPLSTHTLNGRLSAIKSFFKWLTKERYILYNPASELELAKRQRRLPREIFTQEELEQVFSQPLTDEPYGLRDRAILEVLYSTGMRRMELINLTMTSIDYQKGIVFIEQGKGQQDRVIPIGDRALRWCQCYLEQVRPDVVMGWDNDTLFLNQYGEKLSPDGLSRRIKGYIEGADIRKNGSCHLFRHSMATHMLENGADIRYIQEMLGHRKLETTQIYTHVSIGRLKDIHTATHPANRQLGECDTDSDREELATLLGEDDE